MARIIAAADPAADHPGGLDVRAKGLERAPTIPAAPAVSPGIVAAAVTMMARTRMAASSIETAAAAATPLWLGIAGLTA
jgi:hypothetical protein